MSEYGNLSPFGSMTGLSLIVLCCVGLAFVTAGGGAAISGFLSDSLWFIIGGMVLSASGAFFLARHHKKEVAE